MLPDAEGLGEGKIPIYQLCCGACYLLSTFGSSSAEGHDEEIPSNLLCCLSLHKLVQVFRSWWRRGSNLTKCVVELCICIILVGFMSGAEGHGEEEVLIWTPNLSRTVLVYLINLVMPLQPKR